MFHDAPVEAAVAVHRHRRARNSARSPSDAAQRLLRDYQLYRVADFVLKGAKAAEEANATAMGCTPQRSGGRPCEDSGHKCQCSDSRAPQQPSSTTTVDAGSPYMRVALQFPDDLLSDAVAVVHELQRILIADPRHTVMQLEKRAAAAEAHAGTSTTPTGRAAGAGGSTSLAVSTRPPAMDNPHRSVDEVRLFVLADNTFGSCCPDEITAQHYTADCIVHFGDACMSRSTRLPVFYVQPPFHMDALLSEATKDVKHQLPPQQEANLAQAEACVMAEVVRRMTTTLERRTAAWVAEGNAAVTPLLTIVGTYVTSVMLQDVQQMIDDSKTGDTAAQTSAVVIEWPHFERRNQSAKTDIAAAPEADAAKQTSSPASAHAALESEWLVNGVRFHRLPFNDATLASPVVQYLFFIGPTGSPALVHVLSTEQYNQFHYSDICKKFAQWEPMEQEARLPIVSVLDNTLGVDSVKEMEAEAARQVLQAALYTDAEGPPVEATVLRQLVSRWLDCVLPDSVSALVTGDYVVAQQTLLRRVRQRAFNIESIRASSAVGIVVASLAIAGYYEVTQQLHQLLRAYGKRSYVIYVGHMNEFKLANFVDTVDVFVAVACPYSRQSHFPEKRDGFMKPIVSPAELLVALTTSSEDGDAEATQYGMAAVYTCSFAASLQLLCEAVQTRKAMLAARATDEKAGTEAEQERWASSGALVHAGCGARGGALAVQDSSQGSLARLYERSYVGLEPRIGETPVQTEVLAGKHGIARGYAMEREEQGAEPPVSNYK